MDKISDTKSSFKRNHSLKDSWDIALRLLKRLGATDKQIEIMDMAVNAFMEIDPAGSAFRYPDSFKDEQHLKDWSLINLIVLQTQCKQIFDVAYSWHNKLECQA